MLVVGLVAGSCAVKADAATTYQTGFETPTITTGQLSGQDDWSGDGGPSSLVLVENTLAYQGTQAVSVTASATAISGAQHADPVALLPGNTLSISDFANFSATGSANYWTVIGGFYSSGGYILLNVDGSGQIILSTDTGNIATGVHVSLGSWNQYDLTMNYGTDTVTAYYNGVAAGSKSFAAADANLSDVQFYTQPNAAATSQVGYFDNVSVVVNPEPSTGLYLLEAGIMFAAIRRRSTKVNE